MKQHTLYQFLLVGLLFVSLGSCSSEAIVSGSDDGVQDTRLTISVTDGGYLVSADGKSITRTTDEGYKTQFSKGDKVGLYAVKGSDILTDCNNVLLTYDGTKWMLPQGKKLYYEGIGVTYYGYYPYQETLVGTLAPGTDNFFADVVAKWTPATTQSPSSVYTAQDLMTGSGTIGNKLSDGTHPLSITLTHQMALVVIEFPCKKYILTDADNKELPAYSIDICNPSFSGFVPLRMSLGNYRYLVNPAKQNNFVGTYYNTHNNESSYTTSNWTFNADNAAGSYKSYKIDGGVATITHTLQIGDFYMKDGSLLPVGTITLSDGQKANCAGVVFNVGQHETDSQDYSSTGIGQAKCHGYVAEWHDAPSLFTWQKREGVNNVLVGASEADAYWMGYHNQQLIETFVKNNQAGWKMEHFPAANYCKTNAAPTNSSGWFLPNANQLYGIYVNNELITAQCKKIDVNGVGLFKGNDVYYATGAEEHGDVSAFKMVAAHVQSSSFKYEAKPKTDNFHVKAILAF